MEKFLKIGFVSIDEETLEYITSLNSNLKPLLLRYQGMGNYELLVEGKTKFILVDMGGENGWTSMYNEGNYKKLKDGSGSLDEIWEETKKKRWTEITEVKELDGGEEHITIEHNPTQ